MHGYQHTAVQLALLVPTSVGAVLLHQVGTLLPFAAAYVAGTLLVTPDLDLRFNDARRNWGALRFIWGPYARFSKHRGMSHTYLAGPVIRLLYLALWVLPVVVLARHLLPDGPRWSPDWGVVALLLAGYFVSQWLHLLEDGILPWRSSGRAYRE